MIKIPNSSQAAELQACFRKLGFSSDKLEKSLSMSMLPSPQDFEALEERTRQQSPANALIRLFMLGLALPGEDAEQLLPADLINASLEFELVQSIEGSLVPEICLMPVGDLLVASDVVDKLAPEFVLPANTHSATYLNRCVPRTRVRTALDLGCGCGIHALYAAGHSDAVIATDINPAAVRFTRFNAALNGIMNVTALEGDLFEPVEGHQFDLIISNPPFVLSPETTFTYRGNPMNLDDFCRMLVGEASGYLADQGRLVMLGEWVERAPTSWKDDSQTWLSQAAGCDVLVLRNAPVSPSKYVELRLANSGTAEDDKPLWLEYLQAQGVSAVHPCVVLLRKNPAARNWRNELLLTGDVAEEAATDIDRAFDGEDLLRDCADDESMLLATFQVAGNLQVLEEAGPAGHPTHARVGLTGGLPLEASVEVAILAFLAELDGKTTLDECISRFCSKVNADRRLLAGDLVSAVRTFVSRAFVVPVDLNE